MILYSYYFPQLKDYKRAEIALDSFMSVHSMTTVQGGELKKKMDTTDILAYPLLQWYVSAFVTYVIHCTCYFVQVTREVTCFHMDWKNVKTFSSRGMVREF